MEIKKNEKGAKRSIAKLFLNGLYGKFATKPKSYTAVAALTTAYTRNNIIRTANKCYDRFQYADTDSIIYTEDKEKQIKEKR